MSSRYVAAIRQGDAAAIVWLMRDGPVDEAAIHSRIATYRRLPTGTTLVIEPTEHSVAAYLKGARIADGSQVIDEIGVQHQGGRLGDRWRLFFPASASR